ncbi:leucine-rich repeat-containing protein 51 [Apteryx mantelli]|uniref:Leucine-rich repeat-containing protein 51 n=1 Tax=Apteryx mantelli TaxID=2696672 RepID=A0ABM4DYW2_9AVES
MASASRWEPWQRPLLAPPLDFSFRGADSVQELLAAEAARGGSGAGGRPLAAATAALRLNNNGLRGLAGLAAALEQLLAAPERLRWLDLSFNALPAIDPVLTRYHDLRRLDLHANGIRSLAEVDKLAALPRLRRLTLHGNPVEEQRGYRSYVLAALPQLRSFDFSGVTEGDRATAAAWQRMNAKRKGAGKGARGAGGGPPCPSE